jgi:very-short-patch-repair endonuclease
MSALENPPRYGEGDRSAQPSGGGGSPLPARVPLRRPQTYSARKLRRDMTLPEVLIWQRLRAGQTGYKLRKQHPVGPYIVDFCCVKEKLIVEVDGKAHDVAERAVRDAERDRYLETRGYDVLRLMASDVLADIDWAVAAIVARLDSPLHHASGMVPLPAGGEDFR